MCVNLTFNANKFCCEEVKIQDEMRNNVLQPELCLKHSPATRNAYLECKVSSLKGNSNRPNGQNYKTKCSGGTKVE